MTEIEAMDIMTNLHRDIEYHYAENDCYPKGIDDDIANALDTIMTVFARYRRYCDLGTLEECKDAVDKQTAKRVMYQSITTPKKLIYKSTCPTCLNQVNTKYRYCQTCGQAIELSDNKEAK